MGVLECVRKGCRNIMCDRYSYTYGYLCNECFGELCRSNLDMRVFMETEAGTYPQRTSRREEYDEEFQVGD